MEKINRKIKKYANKTNISIVVLIISFIGILILVRSGKMVSFDKAVSNFIITTIPEAWKSVLEIITNIGGSKVLPIIVVVTFFLLICLKKRKQAFLTLTSIISSTITYLLIKNLIQRPRPEPFRFITEISYSFPSGHATNNMVFYGTLIFLINTNITKRTIKIILSIMCIIWILIIGISRIYFNVHYASDIIAGYILGIIIILIATKIFNKNKKQ